MNYFYYLYRILYIEIKASDRFLILSLAGFTLLLLTYYYFKMGFHKRSMNYD